MEREIIRKQHNRFILKLIFIIIFLVIVAIMIVLHQSQSPIHQIKRESINIAKRDAKITRVDNFYISNLNQTYYTIGGTNKSNQHLLVIINKNGGKATILNQSKGITIDQAKSVINEKKHPKKFFNISPSIYENQPVWSVGYLNKNGQLCYCKLQFKNGRILQVINNV